MTDEPDDPRRRASRPVADRLQMLEEDAQSHARLISELLKTATSFSAQQLDQLRTVIREELGDAGLRIDGPDHIDEARRDFMFMRKIRKGAEGYASKIGWFFIAAILGGVVWLVTAGLTFWKTH